MSVRKSLQRGFRKYLTYGEASNQLLMHKLQGLVLEVEKYKQVSQPNILVNFTMCYVINVCISSLFLPFLFFSIFSKHMCVSLFVFVFVFVFVFYCVMYLLCS